MASHGATFDVLFGLVSHTLTECQEPELVHSKPDSLDELLDITEWISTRTQNEDDWCEASGLRIDLLVADWRRLDIVFVHLVDDEVLDGVDDSVWSNNSHEHQNLIFAELLGIATWNFSILGGFEIIPCLPLVLMLDKVIDETSPNFSQSFQSLDIFPAVLRQPGSWLLLFNWVKRGVTLEEEVELDLVERVVTVHDHGDHLETVHELMLLENTHASEIVNKHGQLVFDISQSILQDIIFSRGRKRVHEYCHVG